jgi:hypothetical protein
MSGMTEATPEDDDRDDPRAAPAGPEDPPAEPDETLNPA